ncbi:hypothetical protein N9E62_04245 [Salibacteraceae bacterium]|nr:hypothetical protein [Salibacteraceae bacterium]
MIGLYEYNLMSIDEKAQLLWDSGEFLLSNKTINAATNLYSFSDFFVEVIYSNELNKIIDINTFKNDTRLEPYLDLINVSKLLK